MTAGAVTAPAAGGGAARSRHVDANGVRLHYLASGSAERPPVLFLHGGSAHAHWWDSVTPALTDRYRCLALDLRGHGDSEWPAAGDYRLAANAADVSALADALRLDRFALIGHSFGGFVAMTYAATAGTRLAALIIVDSRVRIGERSARYMDALRKFPHPVYPTVEEAVRRFRLLPSGSTARADLLEPLVRAAIRPRPDGTWTLKFDRRAMAGTPPQDFSAGIARLRCPLLAIRGEHSTIVSRAALEEFRAAAPSAQLVEIAGAHHHIMLDQPAALADTIGAFLDRVRRDRAAPHHDSASGTW